MICFVSLCHSVIGIRREGSFIVRRERAWVLIMRMQKCWLLSRGCTALEHRWKGPGAVVNGGSQGKCLSQCCVRVHQCACVCIYMTCVCLQNAGPIGVHQEKLMLLSDRINDLVEQVVCSIILTWNNAVFTCLVTANVWSLFWHSV